ncbi:hypothetical protein IW140_005482 [Coemansia sp. RSA 1813]|nr:hypothetical protein IW140_005482 [Coemansia sp. RSA 1813]
MELEQSFTLRHSLDDRKLRTKRRLSSPKFFAKVTWVDTLSQLAGLVPLNQISVPEPVYDKHTHSHKPTQSQHSRTREADVDEAEEEEEESQAFGVALDKLVANDDNTVASMLPKPLLECISFIRREGLDTEGLFRRSPPSTSLRAAKESYNRGQPVDLEALGGVHVAAVLLKLFYRELPFAVFSSYAIVRGLPLANTTKTNDDSQAVAEQMDTVRARYVKEEVLGSLSKEYRRILCFTFALLSVVAQRESVNKMTAYNLAIVWAPNLARSADPVEDVAMCASGPGAATVGSVVQIMVQSFGSVFMDEIAEITAAAPDSQQQDDAANRVLDAIDQSGTSPTE